MNLNKITNTIYQCDYHTAKTIAATLLYKDYGIRGVLCPAYNAGLDYSVGLSSLVLTVDDYDTVDKGMFDLVCGFYRLCNPLLIHCMGGKNRSVAFSAMLACKYEGMGLESVYDALGHWHTQELRGSVGEYIST